MAKPKIHKLKAITTWQDYISLCGKTVHQHTASRYNSEVNCSNCLRMLKNV